MHTMPRKRQALKVQKAVICILANDPTPVQANDEAIEKAGDAVIDRIKKCFARAKHANANEAEMRAAFKMADRIIKQHGLESYREMMQEDQTQRLKRGGMSKVNIWPANEEGSAVMQGWVNWLFHAIKIFFDCDAYSTEYAKEIEWTFYGIAEHTVSAAIAFEAVHNQIQEWAAQVKGVSTRNSYSLGVADGLLTLAERTKKKTEEEARQYEARALAARIREEDMKRQTELYKLRNPSPEPTPELESEDGMDLDETDNPGDTEGADDTGDVSDNEVMPNYSERHDAAAPAVTVDMKADFDTELNKFTVPDPVAPTNNPGLPSRREFLDDDDAALPSTEEADEPTEMEETAAWKSMRQLSHWREMSKDIANDVLAENKIKLRKGRKVKRSVKDKDAFKKGQKDSEKIEIQAARIEQGEGTEDVKPEEADSAMIIDG